MYVCVCRAVTLVRIEAEVEAGATTVNAVRDACGAGAECGGCRGEVREVIRECLRRDRRNDEAA
jgi:bacterioferritin-associated ferredoxin